MSTSKLDEFWVAQDWATLEKVNGWKVRKDEERVFLDIPAKDNERYSVLCLCSNYPQEAPSVIFVNCEGSKDDPQAWPTGTADFFQIIKSPPNCFLCTNLTKEGLTHHPDWKNTAKAWNGERNNLMDVFNLIHRLLHSEGYTGRGKKK